MTSLAFIGFGEVGQTFARELLANEGVRIAAYDLAFDDPGRMAQAKAGGVQVGASARDACGEAAVVFSAVTASAAAGVAKHAGSFMRPGQTFFDINSASPRTKRLAAGHIQTAGARFVEGAVMARVAGTGIKVPILAGGPAAQDLARLLNGLGMNVTPVATEYGRASAMKLCRSIVMKGLEAIVLDCTGAARKWDVEKEVFASLQATHPGLDWTKLGATMAERVGKHGKRRAAEMREAGEMLEELGLDPALCHAIADLQARLAKP